ncbi:hypothetical protein HK098_004550 [Nowakowskiella sp. JEL0407]|nr:hypothetical protein HK098_004550 [Nowakowskiella sp. JEL0407]
MTTNNSLFQPQGRAFVKNIISGDTVVLRGKPVGGPPPERIVSFSNGSAPRVGSVKEPEREEEFAFQSREYLRKLLIGKEVAFKIEYTTTTNKRDFGVLSIAPPGIDGETNVTKLMVKAGWLKVKAPSGKNQLTEEQGILAEMEAGAQIAQNGMYSGESGVRKVSNEFPVSMQDFVEKNKGKEIPAIIEQVRDGATYRVLLLLPTGHVYTTLQLSGLRAPTVRKDIPGTPDLVEPFGEESRYFVESRLLQREVTITIEGTSSNNLIGSVNFPAGNIAEALLSEGLATIANWSITLVTGGAAKLRAAETKAKEKKLRLWKDYVAKQKINNSNFEAVVTKILGPDLIQVQPVGSTQERKIAIASVRSPKPKEPKEAGYIVDAREFLRSKLIGKKVQVNIDYIKPAQGEFEERECATVKVGDVNIGEKLIAQGLAGLLKYKRDDDNRASNYDQLLAAEEAAIKGLLGIHSGKEKEVEKIDDASENITQARKYFPSLQRLGTVNGVVEFVSSGSRFKVRIPSQRIKITLVLGGIRCPRAARPGEEPEPFGQEALDYANRKVLQRDVEISIEGQDKVGGFIGTLLLTGRHNFAVLLAAAGFAEVHEYSAKQSPYAKELLQAGEEAKKARKGIWSIKDPYAVEENGAGYEVTETPVEDTNKLPEAKPAVVSEISGGNVVFLQFLGDEIKRLEKMMVDFANFHKTSNAPAYTPKTGEYVSAKFTADDQWYRARVKKINHEGDKKTYQILYIDYGNSQTVTSDRLRPLDARFSTMTLPAQASEAEFAYLNMPKRDADYGEDLYDHLRDILEDQKLDVRTVGKVTGASGGQVLSVLLYEVGNKTESINEKLVRDGYATVAKVQIKRMQRMKAEGKNVGVLEKLVSLQEEAKRNRAGMWRYGDCTEDD